MNSALQNRLVGTIIVVALVVILLPEVLDGEKTKSNQEFVDIPTPPNSIVVESGEAFPQQLLDENAYRPAEIIDERPIDDAPDNVVNPEPSSGDVAMTNSKEQQNISETAAEVATTPAPEVEIEVKDSGWVVQLGSFRYEKNVNELIATLKQAGYRAYSRPVQTNVGVLNKVFVGPELERARLEKALPHLEELTKLKGKITAFEVSAQ